MVTEKVPFIAMALHGLMTNMILLIVTRQTICFFVSMYDHLHQRGYVKETPAAPMCACAEQMPTATRSDCTQIDVDEKYRIEFSAEEYSAVLIDIEIDFNGCNGKNNRNNDLAAYVRRLVDEGKITADQRYALSEHLVENNNCPMAMKYHMENNNCPMAM